MGTTGRLVVLIVAILIFVAVLIYVEMFPTTRQVSLGKDIKPTPQNTTIECLHDIGVGVFIRAGISIRMSEEEYEDYCRW